MGEPRVGPQRGDEGLLEAVVGVDAADGRSQHAEHLAGVPVEQGLERWEGGGRHVRDYAAARPRETTPRRDRLLFPHRYQSAISALD